MGTGLMLMNTQTDELRWFSSLKVRYGVGSDAHIRFVISDDGRFVATFDYNIEPRIYSLNDSCTISSLDYTQAFVTQTQSKQSCPDDGGRMQNALSSRFNANEIRSMSAERFSDDGDVLYFLRYVPGNDPASMNMDVYDVSLQSNGYMPSQGLDYLALGDSYSSGQGDTGMDTNGKSFYLPYTDSAARVGIPENRCHISKRSYPFLLALYSGISVDKMHSVACSGALTTDIKNDKVSGTYVGQRDMLASVGLLILDQFKAKAEAEFIPGYIEQIDFVEKYQPKAVTLTIGGNDAGFADVIEPCARSFFTCSYASEDKFRAILGESIKNQFGNIKNVVDSLKMASPNTKIFLLGYPEFIYSGAAICGLNVGLTDSAERQMINESVEYMNEVIKAAAEAVGVMYVDIEDSLAGGRMCELGGYVTGLSDVRFDSSNYESTFHPNAKGHSKINLSIQQQLKANTLLDYPYTQTENSFVNVPAPSPYFAGAMSTYNKKAQRKTIVQSSAIKQQAYEINIDKYSFEVGTTVTATLYSDPIDLGQFTVLSDGSLLASIVIPDTVPAGFHTLMLSAKTYSGEPIDLYQAVLVKSANSNDVDEDGINDSTDPCLFIEAANVDADGDDVDDACDQEITDPSPFYNGSAGGYGGSSIATQDHLVAYAHNMNEDSAIRTDPPDHAHGGTDVKTQEEDFKSRLLADLSNKSIGVLIPALAVALMAIGIPMTIRHNRKK